MTRKLTLNENYQGGLQEIKLNKYTTD